MQSAQEILNRIEQLESEQKQLDKAQKQQKESIIANQQEALSTYRSVDSVLASAVNDCPLTVKVHTG